MATLLLAGLGSAIGGAILPAGISVAGQTIAGAAIGQAVGATIGRSIDQALLGPTQTVTGPRLDGMDIQTAQEGAGLPVVEGRARIAGQIIWATRVEEVTTTTSHGGKGGGPKVESTEYTYFANFAVALTDCTTGPLRHFGRIWADGKPLDTADLTIRFYPGTETQSPDPLIVAKDGAAPAYRGVSYVVFERLPINDFGRRIPNLAFEVWGPSGEMEDLIQGVDMIPAATEFGYSPSVVKVDTGGGSTKRENAIRNHATSDWSASLDHLEGVLPQCSTVALVVSWFGTDLRAGRCEIEPRVEIKGKNTVGRSWSASGLNRDTATLVSHVDGKPAFGSAPDDQSIMDAIQDLNSRGFRVVLYPFIMMDIPSDNTLADPDTGTPGQPAYPWRGRIRASSDTATEGSFQAQIQALLGTATPADFSTGSSVPAYSGPNEWSYRRFILHLAALARNAGGVDAFLIGSELIGLTTSTETAGQYPFVDGLVALASDVKSMLPSAAISYAADWSEYHSHRDGGEVFFHLDSLWSDANVDFVGIDNYLPLSDWRPGNNHLDYDPETGVTSPYSLDYLKSQIEGGEYWDYYYSNDAARASQTRTPIFDGAHGEDWVFRQKAIRDWWSNAHHNRPGSVRDGSPTAWSPSSKPVWFTEYGCPAVHLGTNQPNVFYDELSSEAALPYFSSGARDDFAQRQYTRAMVEYWRDNGGAMLDTSNMFAWAWDARPWPEFPRQSDLWSDGPNWRRGHWLNGRAGSAPAAEVIQRRLESFYGYGLGQFDLTRCFGQVDGTVLPGPVSFREMVATWESALRLDVSEFGGIFKVAARAAAPLVADYLEEDLVEEGSGPLYQITRASLEETPRAAVVRFSDTDKDYASGAARAAIRQDPGQAEAVADLAVVSDVDRMTGAADMMLRAKAEERETVSLTLPPSSDLTPGQVFTLTPRGGDPLRFIADQITRGVARKVRARLYSGAVFAPVGGPTRPGSVTVTPASETAQPYLLDLPLLPGVDMEDHQGLAAFLAAPWPGGVDLHRSTDPETGFSLNLRTGLSATIGETLATLPPGRVGLWSPETLEVSLFSRAFVSRPEIDVLNGANALAIEHAPGAWEVVQFKDAVLVASDTWHLTGLLRGQLGTEWTRDSGGLAAGARVVLIDSGVSPVTMSADDIGRDFYWRAAPVGRDPAEVVATPHAFTGAARRPFAPVHLSATVTSGPLLSLTWIRRSRIEADDWPDSGDVPLGEAFERYLVEVGPEGAPLASLEVSDQSFVSDWDLTGLAGQQEVRVSQISETYGPGTPARITVSL